MNVVEHILEGLAFVAVICIMALLGIGTLVVMGLVVILDAPFRVVRSIK